MSTLQNFDNDARAELLCCLVVGQLVAMARKVATGCEQITL
jgi:hypothetical protein